MNSDHFSQIKIYHIAQFNNWRLVWKRNCFEWRQYTGTLVVSFTATASSPFPAVVLPLLPLLVCATVPSSHSAALSLILHPSLHALHGVYLISLPVHLIARSARLILPERREGARPHRPALLLSLARKEERRGKEANFFFIFHKVEPNNCDLEGRGNKYCSFSKWNSVNLQSPVWNMTKKLD